MLAKRIIPYLDVRDGQVVKGVQFRNHEIIGDIVPLAKRYAQEGADAITKLLGILSPWHNAMRPKVPMNWYFMILLLHRMVAPWIKAGCNA